MSTTHEISDSSVATFPTAPFASKHPKGFGEMVLVDGVSITQTYLLPVPHLRQWLPEKDKKICNRRKLDTLAEDSVERKSTYNKIMGESDVILGDIRRNNKQTAVSRAYLRAGPRLVNLPARHFHSKRKCHCVNFVQVAAFFAGETLTDIF